MFDSRGRLIKSPPEFVQQVARGRDIHGRSIWELAANPEHLRSQFSRCAQDDETVFDVTEVATPDGPVFVPHTYFKIPRGAVVGCAYDEPLVGTFLESLEVQFLRELGRHDKTVADAALALDISVSTAERLLRSAKLKLRVKTIQGAVFAAREHGLI